VLGTQITVKCDVATFAWLMAYIKTDISEALPQPDLSNCLQLLIASHYLQVGVVRRVSYYCFEQLHGS